MTDREENSIHAETRGHSEVDNDFIPSDARPLCPNCLRPCGRLQFYCENCDSNEAINPLASYMPFVRIRFNIGMLCKMWRRIWADKDMSITCWLFFVFLVLMGAPVLLVIGLPLTLISEIKNLRLRKTARTAFWLIIVLLLIAYLISVFLKPSWMQDVGPIHFRDISWY